MKKGNHNIVTWKDAARLLHALRPKTYTTWALMKIFNKNQGTIYYALHPEKRAAMEKKRPNLAQRRANDVERRRQKRRAQRVASPVAEYQEDLRS